jgi:hypothetical protein
VLNVSHAVREVASDDSAVHITAGICSNALGTGMIGCCGFGVFDECPDGAVLRASDPNAFTDSRNFVSSGVRSGLGIRDVDGCGKSFRGASFCCARGEGGRDAATASAKIHNVRFFGTSQFRHESDNALNFLPRTVPVINSPPLVMTRRHFAAPLGLVCLRVLSYF